MAHNIFFFFFNISYNTWKAWHAAVMGLQRVRYDQAAEQQQITLAFRAMSDKELCFHHIYHKQICTCLTLS